MCYTYNRKKKLKSQQFCKIIMAINPSGFAHIQYDECISSKQLKKKAKIIKERKSSHELTYIPSDT